MRRDLRYADMLDILAYKDAPWQEFRLLGCIKEHLDYTPGLRLCDPCDEEILELELPREAARWAEALITVGHAAMRDALKLQARSCEPVEPPERGAEGYKGLREFVSDGSGNFVFDEHSGHPNS